jgi:hypothetical protein
MNMKVLKSCIFLIFFTVVAPHIVAAQTGSITLRNLSASSNTTYQLISTPAGGVIHPTRANVVIDPGTQLYDYAWSIGRSVVFRHNGYWWQGHYGPSPSTPMNLTYTYRSSLPSTSLTVPCTTQWLPTVNNGTGTLAPEGTPADFEVVAGECSSSGPVARRAFEIFPSYITLPRIKTDEAPKIALENGMMFYDIDVN